MVMGKNTINFKIGKSVDVMNIWITNPPKLEITEQSKKANKINVV